MKIPTTFKVSKLAPSMGELDWLVEWLSRNVPKGDTVLEFGCGITTLAFKTIDPSFYCACETWPESRKSVSHVVGIQLVDSWSKIPKRKYDVVFIDSSAGCGKRGLHRRDAAILAESFAPDALMIIHDWLRRSGRDVRQYLEQQGYRLIAHCDIKSGIGIYQR